MGPTYIVVYIYTLCPKIIADTAGKHESIPPSQAIVTLNTIKYPMKLPSKYPMLPTHIRFTTATIMNTFLNPILSCNRAQPVRENALLIDCNEPTIVNSSSFNPI